MSVTCLVHDLAALCKTFHSEAASGSDVQLPLEQFPQWVYGRKKLEVMHQAGYQDTPLPDLHSPCLVVWVRDTTKLQCSRIDTFDMWALRKIPRIPYTRHVTNVEVRATL